MRTKYESAEKGCTMVEGTIHLRINNENIVRRFELVELAEPPFDTEWVEKYHFAVELQGNEVIYVANLDRAASIMQMQGKATSDIIQVRDLWR